MRLACILFVALITIPFPSFGQGLDYVTDEEADLIRDAQGILVRVPVFLKLADNRLVVLGLRERTAKEREEVRRDIEKYEREVKEAAKIKNVDVEVRAKPVNPDVYLRKHTPTELLRGYTQIIDEVMSNLEDAYERRMEVRSAVEDLDKFVRQGLPLLRKYQPKNASEEAELKSAIEHSEETLRDIKGALEKLPKTERKPK
jgi:hypothetical protein